MQICLPDLKRPALIGLLLVLPFVALEVINRGLHAGFPFPLFGFLWFLPVIIIATVTPLINYLRVGGNLLDHPFSFFTRLLILILLGALWIGTIADQMPCFLGVPNCD